MQKSALSDPLRCGIPMTNFFSQVFDIHLRTFWLTSYCFQYSSKCCRLCAFKVFIYDLFFPSFFHEFSRICCVAIQIKSRSVWDISYVEMRPRCVWCAFHAKYAQSHNARLLPVLGSTDFVFSLFDIGLCNQRCQWHTLKWNGGRPDWTFSECEICGLCQNRTLAGLIQAAAFSLATNKCNYSPNKNKSQKS